MRIWYVRGPQGTQGPLSADEVCASLQDGSIDPSSQAYMQGNPQWQPILGFPEFKGVKIKRTKPAPSPVPSPAPSRADAHGGASSADVTEHLPAPPAYALDPLAPSYAQQKAEALVQYAKGVITAARIERACQRVGGLSESLGVFNLGVGFICGVFLFVEAAQLALLVTLVSFLSCGLAALYTTHRMTRATQQLLARSRYRMRSSHLLDSVGALGLSCVVALALFAVYQVVQGALLLALISAGGACALVLISGLALSPAALGIDLHEEASGGEEVIAMLLFFPRCLLRLEAVLVPLVLAVSGFSLLMSGWELLRHQRTWSGLLYFGEGVTLFFYGTLMPLALYVVYSLLSFILDIANKIIKLKVE